MSDTIIRYIRDNEIRFDRTEGEASLQPLVDRSKDATFALLGEASHGTSEFYTIRAELSKRLIQEEGFSFVAVEGDWPSCYVLNRYVKGGMPNSTDVKDVLRQSLKRWPTWMWANDEVADFLQWLRGYNSDLPEEDKVGFYGLDMYSLWESMEEVIRYLEKIGSPDVEQARAAFACFEPFERDAQQYGVSSTFFSESCEEEVIETLLALQKDRNRQSDDAEAILSADLNAMVSVSAEKYYRAMIRGGPESWNIRDEHMTATLERLMTFHQERRPSHRPRAIVWEHNTHIGDARATDMLEDGMVNVGQLVRERHGLENVFAVGFGTHRGTVIAADRWGGEIEELRVPPAYRGSWEDLLHKAGAYDRILLMDDDAPFADQEIGQRAIGVVYHPDYERGNYVPSKMTERYDAFVFIDETRALKPLVVEGVVV